MWSLRKMTIRMLFPLVLVAGLCGTATFAQDLPDAFVAQLKEQGFAIVLVENTWLGRIRVLAQTDQGTREIILNPTTGEVLRDLWTPKQNAKGVKSADKPGSQAEAPSGSGGAGNTQDTDDDSDDDDDGDDNDGSGQRGRDDSTDRSDRDGGGED
jgi:hypothetical protein